MTVGFPFDVVQPLNAEQIDDVGQWAASNPAYELFSVQAQVHHQLYPDKVGPGRDFRWTTRDWPVGSANRMGDARDWSKQEAIGQRTPSPDATERQAPELPAAEAADAADADSLHDVRVPPSVLPSSLPSSREFHSIP